MLFLFDVGVRARIASRLIGNLRNDLVAAVVHHRKQKAVSQQQMAQATGMSRSDLNGYLTGQKELTLRSLSDIAFALDKEVIVELRDFRRPPVGNHFPGEESLRPAAACLVRPREAVTRSSSRALRTFVTQTVAERND